MSSSSRVLFFALFALLISPSIAHGKKTKNVVTYDGRSLMVNGNRELLFSGSIHYPRSPPEMWPELIRKAKEGGLNVIQTYIFWNLHEPVKGQFNFEGNFDFVKFIRLIGEQGLYVTLRVGPFIEAEWNHGGFPYWLREVPNIIFRADNEPFKYHMQKYVKMIIDKVKEEKLFFPQGGPIIMSQIENEYNNVQLAYREKGTSYIQWAANMAVGLQTGVPWIMCKQRDAPDPVINTCNGRHCGETFTGPNKPNKPSLWTENWTAQYRVFGDPPSQRAAEDISYAVARFFSKNGTLTNYYMYHGGTNFARTSSSFVTTRYYDEAPLDEFGMQREPKFGHLRDLHRALKLSKKALLWGSPAVQRVNQDLEIRTYENAAAGICAAFLNNNNTKLPATINFRGEDYYLPPKSISILPDCKTVVYNTQNIVSQHNARKFHPSSKAKNLQWTMHQESIPTYNDLPVKSRTPRELYSFAMDTSDYAWYSTSIDFERSDLPMKASNLPVLQVASLGHAMVAFVNGEYVGSEHGSNIEKSFVLQKPIKLHPGVNTISLLAMTVGFPDSGAYMEHRYAGIRAASIQGLNAGTLDITHNEWGQEVGVKGEREQYFTEEGSEKAKWTTAKGPGGPVTWYKTYFDAPEGNSPVAIKMTSMSKGFIWVNGNNIGRYWVSYLSPLKEPTQSEYHVPRAWLKPTKNLMVVFEENGGDPEGITVMTVNRDTICSYVTEYHVANVKSWKRSGSKIQTMTGDEAKSGAHLTCSDGKVIKMVEFASYGDPVGACGGYLVGKCTSPLSQKIVEQYCLGKNSCVVPMDKELFGGKKQDSCPDISKTLAVQVRCGHDHDN